MTIEEKKAKVMQHLIAAEMILPADQESYLESFITTFDRTYPEHEDVDKYEKAFAMICNGGKYETDESTELQDITSVEPKANVTKPATVLISSEETAALREKLHSMKELTDSRSRSTLIEGLIADRPSTAVLFKNIDTFIADKEKAMKTLERYKDLVVTRDYDGELQDGELSSQERYNRLVAAVEAGEPIEIAKSDKITKIIGVDLTYEGETRKMDLNNLALYVAACTSGYILAQPGRPGAELILANRKQSKSNPDAPKETITSVRIKNRKEVEAASNIKIASQPTEKEVEYSVRSKMNFKVFAVDDKGNKIKLVKKVNGKDTEVYKIRTVSLTGKVTAGKLERLDEYKDTFPMADPVRAAKGLDAPVGKKAEELRKKHIQSIALLVRSMNSANLTGISDDLAARLKEFDDVIKTSQSSAVGASF